MKKEFEEYVTGIGMPAAFIARVESLLHDAQFMCPDEIDTIFVNEYIKEDGGREYEALYLFSKTHVLEAKNFQTEDDIDVTSFRKVVYYTTLKKSDFDLKTANDRSRMYVKCYLGSLSSVHITLKASRENCNNLATLFNQLLKPNMV